MKRKAIQLSNNTLVVSLPAPWVRKNKVLKGSEVDVSEFENRLILASEQKKTHGQITVDVSGMDPMIKRILGSLYKSGYDEVKVKFSTIKELKVVQEVVREEFLGFEIIDQKKDWLTFKKVSHIDAKEFRTMMRRMFLIILSMGDDSLQAIQKKDKEWLEAIILHDKDVNKIADFCRRVLNTTGAEGFKRIPPGYFIVEQLEKVGDLYRDLSKLHLDKPHISKQLLPVYKETNRFLRTFYNIYFDFNLESLRDLGKERYRLKKVFEKAFKNLKKDELQTLAYLQNVVESTFDMNGPLMAVYL